MHQSKFSRAFTLVELLVVIAIIGVLISMLIPAVQMVREAARRSACSNRLRQIALAAHSFHDTQNHFPPGVVDDDGNLLDATHSGFVFLLPHLEQLNLFEQYDLESDWKSTNNRPLAQVNVEVFKCPTNQSEVGQDGGVPGSATDYLLVKGSLAYLHNQGLADGVFDVNSQNSFGDIHDGASNTLFMGEGASNAQLTCEGL